MVTEARRRATKKWNKEKVDRITLRIPKGKKELISIHAKKTGETINGMINRLIDEELNKDK